MKLPGVVTITAESSDLGLPLQLIVASHIAQTKQWQNQKITGPTFTQMVELMRPSLSSNPMQPLKTERLQFVHMVILVEVSGHLLSRILPAKPRRLYLALRHLLILFTTPSTTRHQHATSLTLRYSM